ncbi:hypothetical protein [Wolbachia endosymbiont of Ctenocephalides felis wCfeT]|uniref:hypothetical protein n=1 Tax=Wolbachia endosymbiont of Ctenocephalides felis wCfeT TaxID=2732593 RepID=UPI001445D8F6|nr:hypothetical protein [Wolbachia endosymbiont of Ctenocephalides felis wCfeT]
MKKIDEEEEECEFLEYLKSYIMASRTKANGKRPSLEEIEAEVSKNSKIKWQRNVDKIDQTTVK